MERREEGKKEKKGEKKEEGMGKKEEKEEQDEMRDTVTMFLSMVRGGARCAAESAATHLESRWKRHFFSALQKEEDGLAILVRFLSVLSCVRVCLAALCTTKEVARPVFFLFSVRCCHR